mmetsp:Transcript_25522/g.64846  ORF Transcript_25522/g.64846 Transcript_25522/m.64846 type:complete len:208 (-) Transcript_25522:293-916(-)
MILLLGNHSIWRSPPGSETVALRSDSPLSTAATSSAHAPVPHASVGPAPRSHTRIARCVRESTCTNSVLVRAGKTGWFSNFGPTVASGSAVSSRASTKTMACGLPIETHVTFHSLPATISGTPITRPCASVGSVVGTLGPSRMGSPMSTFTIPSAVSSGTMGPARVDMVYVCGSVRPSSPATYLAMQRMPFPHISGSEPSELMIRMA